jgi:hypothetical protein
MPTLTTVKREPGSSAPNAPWTVRLVPVEVKQEPGEQAARAGARPGAPVPPKQEPVKREEATARIKRESPEDVRVVPETPDRAAPWRRPDIVPTPQPGAPAALPPAPQEETAEDGESGQEETPPQMDPKWSKPARKRRGPRTAPDSTEFNTSLLRAANYAAVDPSRGIYGLIDQGLSDPGTRALIMHILPKRDAWPVLEKIRPGTLLPAISKSGRGGRTALRVRYTTPTKYFSPGCKVSSVTVGVDEADWQSLVMKAHRI